MKYRDLLELYKKKELEESKSEEIRADIEKHQAIDEYLLEEDAKLEQALGEEGAALCRDMRSKEDEEDANTARELQKMIRRAFLKMGALACAAAVVILLFIVFLLPKAVDSFYYDPGKEVQEDVNQMSLDLAVYTELAVPTYKRQAVNVQRRGYGNYDIVIPQYSSWNGKMTDVAGKVERNKMVLYDPNALKPAAANALGWTQVTGKAEDSLSALEKKGIRAWTSSDGDKELARETLKQLEGSQAYYAYVTLDKRMPYETFRAYVDKNDDLWDVWCAVSTNLLSEGESYWEAADTGELMGFQCTLSVSSLMNQDPKGYPGLMLWPPELSGKELEQYVEKMKTEAFMKQHFTSMLRYMAQQKQFLSMVVPDGEGSGRAALFNQAAEYVEKNGLLIHGFVCVAEKEALLKLLDEDNIYDITPEY